MFKSLLVATLLATSSVASAVVIDFENGYLPVVQYGNGEIVSGNLSGQYAQPFGSTGKYYTSYAGSSVLWLQANQFYNSVRFLHGSVDSYNSLEVYARNGDLIETIQYTGNGDQGPSNTFLRNYSYTQNLGGFKFNSGSNSFEIDNLEFYNAGGDVPEPATWALFGIGFGLLGSQLRARKYKTASA